MTKVPFGRSKTWPLVAAVLLNLIPVVGVLFWGWSAFALIILYWLENLVIGVRTVLSMVLNAALNGAAAWPGALFFAVFFTIHYGMFCAGHGVFIMGFFGNDFWASSIFDLGGILTKVFETESNLVFGLASIIAWQAVQFVLFIAQGDAKRTTPRDLMGAPYPRIMVLHVTIIFGGFVLMLLNEPVAGMLVLALVKMAYDVAEVLRDPKADEPEVDAAKA